MSVNSIDGGLKDGSYFDFYGPARLACICRFSFLWDSKKRLRHWSCGGHLDGVSHSVSKKLAGKTCGLNLL